MVAPVSHFDFHEGSGSTTTSTAGGYVLTTPAPATAWAPGGGIKEHFTGVVGPNALLTQWSVSFRFTMSGEPDGDGWILSHTSAGTSVWCGLAGTSSFPSRRIGLFSPGTEMSADRLDTGVEYVIVYVFTPADTKIYANGELFTTLSGGNTNNFGVTQGLLFTNGDNAFSPMREVSFYDVALTASEVAAPSTPPPVNASVAFAGGGALQAAAVVQIPAPAAFTGAGALQVTAVAQTPAPPVAVTAAFAGLGKLAGSALSTAVLPVPFTPSARDLTRTFMLTQLGARGDPAPWSSSIPAQRPARFFTIEELNSATEHGAAADSQLLQIRGYDNDRERLGKKIRLIKALWAAMPVELKVQNVEHAGGPLYDEDPDIDGLYYGQLIAWVTVMNRMVP